MKIIYSFSTGEPPTFSTFPCVFGKCVFALQKGGYNNSHRRDRSVIGSAPLVCQHRCPFYPLSVSQQARHCIPGTRLWKPEGTGSPRTPAVYPELTADDVD